MLSLKTAQERRDAAARLLDQAQRAATRAGEKVVPIDRLEAVLAAHPAPQTEDEA